MSERRSSTLVRAGCALFAIPTGTIGVWAALAPHHWYAHFPGGGRAWIAADGPYNEHLVRDVGQLYLVVTILFGIAAWRAAPAVVRSVCAAVIVPNALHLGYHLAHLGLYARADQVGNVASLTLNTLFPLALLLIELRGSRTTGATGDSLSPTRSAAPATN